MSEDTTRDPTNLSPQPALAKAPSLTDAEANRQFGQGESPHPVNTAEADQALGRTGTDPDPIAAGTDERTVKVGARDVHRPSAEDDGATGGEGSLDDRLAKKDNTNAGPGPSSVA